MYCASSRQIVRRAQLSDETCRVPGRAAGELLPLEQHDVFPAELNEMIGDAAADDATADDDDLRS